MFLLKMVEREGPTPAPEPCLRCLLVAFSSPLALTMPVVLFRIGSYSKDELSVSTKIRGQRVNNERVAEGDRGRGPRWCIGSS